MEINKKQKLLNYLMPEYKVRQFLCNDLFLELKKLIPNSMCISPQNKSTEKRSRSVIGSFLSRIFMLRSRG